MGFRKFFAVIAAVLLIASAVAAPHAPEKIDWSKADDIRPGIKLTSGIKKSPRLIRYYIMRIDLGTPGLEFVTTGRDADWGKPMPDYPKRMIRTRRRTVAEFMNIARRPVKHGGLGKNLVAAFNATPWGPWVPPFNHKYADPPGLVISNGEVVAEHKQKAQFVIYRDGSVDIVPSIPAEKRPEVLHTLSGFVINARGGKVVPPAKGDRAGVGTAPRTVYGLSAHRRYMYVLAVDGRQPGWSMGVNNQESAQIIISAGASDAINMDGGGSTTMLYWDAAQCKPVMVNRHTAVGNYMRAVATSLGIVLNK